jgi:hypothetical protein
MNGSCATSRIWNAAARRATSWPIRPNPRRLVAKLLAEKLLLLPLSLFHGCVGGGEVTGQRKHQAHREFRDADAVRARRVHHHDAARAGGRHVDVVHARTSPGDHPQCLRRGDQLRGDFRRAADDKRVGIGKIDGELFRCPAGAGVNVPAFGFQKLQCGIREIVGNNDFHDVMKV